MRLFVVCWLSVVFSAAVWATPPDDRYPRDLRPDQWSYKAARDLAARGILTGYPDGTFRGGKPIDRATLAVALSRTLELVDPASGGGLSLPPRDLKTMARLTREFSKELSDLSIRTSALEEKIEGQRVDVEGVKERVDRLAARVRSPERFRYGSGEIRVVGFDHPEERSFSNLILTFEYSVSDAVSGVFSPQLTLEFDRGIGERLGIWEAYTDFAEQGPIERIRVGRQLITLGAGLTLFDRVEGFDLSAQYADVTFQAILLGGPILLAEVEAPLGQRFGFYYIEESRNAFGLFPVHLGAYLKGNIGNRLYVGFEYANYNNRSKTFNNNDRYTEGYLADLKYDPSDHLSLRLSFVTEEEDFRALSIDRDLSFHSPVHSPLEDVLQVITAGSTLAGFPVARSEINGFIDLKAGLDLKLPRSRLWLGLGVDRLRKYSHLFDNTGNEFSIYGARLKLPLVNSSWAELRGRYVRFDEPDPYNRIGTLDIPRVDFSEVRIQWFSPF